jgi:beta-carotene 3-hydroxylase
MSLAVTTSISTNTFCAASSRRSVPSDAISGGRVLFFAPLSICAKPLRHTRRRETPTCLVLEKERTGEYATGDSISEDIDEQLSINRVEPKIAERDVGKKIAEKIARKKSERKTYLIAAVMSSLGITSMAVAAVYYRFAWQMEVRALFSTLFCISIT